MKVVFGGYIYNRKKVLTSDPNIEKVLAKRIVQAMSNMKSEKVVSA